MLQTKEKNTSVELKSRVDVIYGLAMTEKSENLLINTTLIMPPPPISMRFTINLDCIVSRKYMNFKAAK